MPLFAVAVVVVNWRLSCNLAFGLRRIEGRWKITIIGGEDCCSRLVPGLMWLEGRAEVTEALVWSSSNVRGNHKPSQS